MQLIIMSDLLAELEVCQERALGAGLKFAQLDDCAELPHPKSRDLRTELRVRSLSFILCPCQSRWAPVLQTVSIYRFATVQIPYVSHSAAERLYLLVTCRSAHFIYDFIWGAAPTERSAEHRVSSLPATFIKRVCGKTRCSLPP